MRRDLFDLPPLDPTIQAVFDAQKLAAPQRLSQFGFSQRRGALKSLARVIRAQEPAIIEALQADFGKPSAETLLTEVLPALQDIRHALANLRRWMRPKRVRPTLAMVGTSARIIPQARGTCLIIAPWNYPFLLTIGPLISALAAGNSAILKPSELTPATSALIAKIISQTFPKELVAVATGGREVAEALLALPFDHIFFTGSPEVGKKVMAAAAKNLTSVTLELGGKSPAIITSSADIAQAAAWVAFGKFSNAGQACIAPDHVYVHHYVHPLFTKALRDIITQTYGAGTGSLDLAHIVDHRHTARLTRLIQDALAKGAQIMAGGQSAERKIAPTLIEKITPQMEICEQEIFGPILPIIPYSDLGSVIAAINARPKPLALYVFDRNTDAAQIIAGTSSGSVGVNLTMAQFAHNGLPFGGVGMSGMGAGNGRAGFDSFSHQRAVLRNIASPLPLIFAPYTARVQKLIRLLKPLLG